MDSHPLDRPVWNALTTRQETLGIGDARARRFRPEINMFVAGADRAAESLDAIGALVALSGSGGMVERAAFPDIPGTRVEKVAIINQMVATAPPGAADPIDYATLGDADAAEMLALATLTAPGPFFEATHRMGDFIGVRKDGQLIAMAGQRFRVPGYTEISAVCTHPDHRGAGYAGRLMQVLIDRIRASGDTPFLHTYPDNARAIRLYESLGFRFRAVVVFTVLSAA